MFLPNGWKSDHTRYALMACGSLAALLYSGWLARRLRNSPNASLKGLFVITGAGSGMGKETAIRLYRDHGSDLLLVDRNEEALNKVNDELGVIPGQQIVTLRCDLTSNDDVETLCARISNSFRGVRGLLHFAGVTHGKRFVDASVKDIDQLMIVNLLSVIKMTRLLLPTILKHEDPIIVFISSVGGLIGVPHLVDYCASKFGIVGFSDALRRELRQLHPNVYIGCVCPYFVNTGMFKGIKAGLFAMLSQAAVVDRIVDGIVRRDEMVVIPSFMRPLIALGQIMPRCITESIERFMQVGTLMDGYKGRDPLV